MPFFEILHVKRLAANQGMENVQRNNNNLEDDLDQETFETPAVDFTHRRGQGLSNSDLPPSYENCVLESQPPSYSPV